MSRCPRWKPDPRFPSAVVILRHAALGAFRDDSSPIGVTHESSSPTCTRMSEIIRRGSSTMWDSEERVITDASDELVAVGENERA